MPNSGIKETESFPLKVAGAREYGRILVSDLIQYLYDRNHNTKQSSLRM